MLFDLCYRFELDVYVLNGFTRAGWYSTIREEVTLPDNIRKIVDNRAVLYEAKNLLTQLDKLSAALNLIQGDTCSLAEAYGCWLEFCEDMEVPSQTKAALKRRFDMACTPAHILALLTSDDEHAKLVDEEMKTELRAWLEDRGLLAAFAHFEVQDEDAFPRHAFGSVRTKMLQAKFWRWVIQTSAQITEPVRAILELILI